MPDAYLSFLTTSCIVSDPKWAWLKESLLAELRHRGLNAAAVADEVLSEPEDQQEALPLAAVVAEQRPRRAYAL